MNDRPLGGDWEARRWYTDQRTREKQSAGKHLPRRNRSDNRDGWIERYLPWLSRETILLGGGPIAQHYLRCAQANYTEYFASGDVSARYRAWLAIRFCCQWLAQLGGQQHSGVNTAWPQPKRAEASQPEEQRRPQPNFNEYGEPDDIPF